MRVKALLDKVQEEFFKEHGMNAHIQIYVHDFMHTKGVEKLIKIIAKNIARDMGVEVTDIEENEKNSLGWFEIKNNKNMNITIFFKKEEK